jgi:hypothetical protein
MELTSLSNEQEPYFRLLVCRTCKTIDELPSAEEDPGDTLLSITVERHGEDHTGLLYNVPKVVWLSEEMKPQVIQQIQGGSTGLDVFGTQFYATRMQFGEDAMACYRQHNKPKGQCPDYRSEKKALRPQTQKDRVAAGLDVSSAPKIYLCDFCPVKSFNMKKYNEQKGLYK